MFNNTSIQTIILTYIIPPEITTDPTTANVCYGDSATVSIAANGTAPLTYLWLNDTTPVPGATGKSFEATSTMNLRYVVSNKAGSDTSKAAAVTVAPEFIATVAPTSAQQCTGGSATFTASVTGGTAASYVWYKQGSATPAGVAAELDLTATTANAGTYFCVVTGDNECSDTSNTVTFTKNEDVAVEVTGKKHHLRRQQCRSYRHPDRRSITHLPVVPGYPGGRDQQQQIHGDFCRSIQLRGDKQCRL